MENYISNKQYHYLYKTTNLINNRYYYGMHSTNNLEDGYLGSGKRIRYEYSKYGKENFHKEILEIFDTREELIEAEKKLVNIELISDINCLNIKEGGSGGFTIEEQIAGRNASGMKMKRLMEDEDFRKYFSNTMSTIAKKQYADGIRKRINVYDWTGLTHTEETKLKMSISSKGMGQGDKNSQFGTCWITKDNINKKIKKYDLDSYLNEGWNKGRKTHMNL